MIKMTYMPFNSWKSKLNPFYLEPYIETPLRDLTRQPPPVNRRRLDRDLVSDWKSGRLPPLPPRLSLPPGYASDFREGKVPHIVINFNLDTRQSRLAYGENFEI